MLIGYLRISTAHQLFNSQLDILKELGCEKFFNDTISGVSKKNEREGFKKLLEFARQGDTVLVTSLDRLARNLKELLEIIELLKQRNINLRVVNQNIDTSNPVGKLMLQIFGIISEFERDVIRERTITGLKSARIRGKIGGRPRILTSLQIDKLKELYQNQNTTIKELCEIFKIKRSTVYKYCK